MPQTYFESQAHSRLIIQIGSLMPQTYHRLIHALDAASNRPAHSCLRHTSNHRLIPASSYTSAHSCLRHTIGSFMPQTHESWAHSRLIATNGYANHGLIPATSLHTDTRIIGSFAPHRYTRIHESWAHSRLIATHGHTDHWLIPASSPRTDTRIKGGGGDPKPASLDWDRMVDPIHLLLGGGITGVGAVAD